MIYRRSTDRKDIEQMKSGRDISPPSSDFRKDYGMKFENGASTTSRNSSCTSSLDSCPLPPVPRQMAEAITRQQKGSGVVRYWKNRPLQSNGGQAKDTEPPSPFPTFKTALGVSWANGEVCCQVPHSNSWLTGSSCSQSRSPRQKCQLLQGQVRSSDALLSPSQHRGPLTDQTFLPRPPLYLPHPHFVRSVTSTDPLALHPGSKVCTDAEQVSARVHQRTYRSPAKESLKLSPCPPASGVSTLDSPQRLKVARDAEVTEEVKERGAGDDVNLVTDLTCLQLADAILATKTSDLSQFYDICRTRLRYVDLLERSPSFANSTDHPPSEDSQQDQNLASLHVMCGKSGIMSLPSLTTYRAAHSTSVGDTRNGLSRRARKPILKSIPGVLRLGKLHRQNSLFPFCPRSLVVPHDFGDALSVQGTTMAPASASQGLAAEKDVGVIQGSSAESELGKRAVRFNVSHQVHEFAPGEPVTSSEV